MALVSVLVGQGQKGTRFERSIQGNRTAAIFLDATIKESFAAPSELTKHPVEKRADIGDHIILKPMTLEIEGVISETPFSIQAQGAGVVSTVASSIGQNLGGAIGGVAATAAAGKTLAGVLKPKSAVTETDENGNSISRNVSDTGENARLRDAINEFILIRNEKKALTVVTGLQQYKDFILTNFDVTRDQTTGGSIRVSLSLEQFIVANSQKIKIPIPQNKNAIGKQDQGRKNSNTLTGKQEEQGSILFDLIKGN